MVSDNLKLYQSILDGEVSKFPANYWKASDNREKAIECFKYLIEEVLKYKEDDFKNLNYALLKKYKLKTPLANVYENSVYKMLSDVYPGIKPYCLDVSPRCYYDDKENRLDAIRWLIEDKLKIEPEHALDVIEPKMFDDYGIRMAKDKHKGGVYALVKEAYPDRVIKPKNNKGMSGVSFRTEEREFNAYVKDLIAKKLGITDQKDLKNITTDDLRKIGLRATTIWRRYRTQYHMLEAVYGGLPFKYWESGFKVPSYYWEDENNRIEAIKWFINEYNEYLGFSVYERLARCKLKNMVFKYYGSVNEIYKYK